MNLLFFRNGYLLWLAVVVLLVAGASALQGLPRMEDPRITNRNPIIVTAFPGASATRVETLVTERLETALEEVAQIKKLESTSRAGVSSIRIELQDQIGADQNDQVFSQLRDEIRSVALPAGAREPVFDDMRGAVAYTLILACIAEAESDPPLGILTRLAEDLSDQLRNVPGTELVRISGEADEEIIVTVDSASMAAMGLSPEDIATSLNVADTKQPAGLLRGEQTDLAIEVSGEFDSLARVAAVPICTDVDALGRQKTLGHSMTRLQDIADIRRQWQSPPNNIALVDGRRAVFVAARMGRGRRVDMWSADAHAAVDRFRERIGQGVELKTIFDQSEYTTERLGELAINLLEGAGVIVLVIWLLMGWRSAGLVGAALPLVSGMTLFVLLSTGGALHQMSIFGIIIALGLLIDNAIVVVDEIRKEREAGRDSEEAVAITLKHLATPLLASTLTTIFAFAPIMLLPGNIGDFVGSIGSSVVIAVACSLCVALTITAALAGRYDRPAPAARRSWWRHGVQSQRLSKVYRQALSRAFRHPWLALPIALAAPLAGFALASQLGNQFFPRVDRNMFQIQLWLPEESSLRNTRRVAENVERTLRDQHEIRRVQWMIGGSFPSVYYNLVADQDNAGNYAQAIVVTRDKSEVKALIRRLQPLLDDAFPNAQLIVSQFGQGPPVTAPVQFRIYGPSLSVLQDLGDEVRLRLQEHPQTLHAQTTMPRGEPKLWLDADENETQAAGLQLANLSSQLQANLEGTTAGSIVEGLEEMPVRVRFANELRSSRDAIASTNFVTGTANEWIPLSALGDLDLQPQMGGVTRRDGLRCNTVRGYVTNDALPINVTRDVLERLDHEGFKIPSGYRMERGGDSEEQGDAVGKLKTYLPVLVTLTAATLILAFRSVLFAGLLGSVAVLSVGLALLSTWCFGFPISFNTILGTLGLIGVALNDNIVVLAAIRANPAARDGEVDAIVSEILGCTRHLLSTTLTTAGGFLPLILSGGDFWPPLAVVLAGGVIGATVLAVLYLPAAYVLLNRVPQLP